MPVGIQNLCQVGSNLSFLKEEKGEMKQTAEDMTLCRVRQVDGSLEVTKTPRSEGSKRGGMKNHFPGNFEIVYARCTR